MTFVIASAKTNRDRNDEDDESSMTTIANSDKLFKDEMKFHYLFALLICGSLQSCTPLGVATTGIQAVYDHHNLQKKFNDNCITMQAYNKIYRETNNYQDANISIATFNREVLLTGNITNNVQKKEIEQKIASIEGVEKVYNRISISPPTSTLIHVSDSWITAKIKSKLIAMQDIDPSQIKVVTENGTVYLMGIVPYEQADTAIELARSTDGVQNVVKIFSYLRICKE